MYIGKKIAIITGVMLLFMATVSSVYGQTPSQVSTLTPTSIPKNIAFELDLLNKLLLFIKQHPNFMIRNNTTVTAINGTTLTVKKNGQVYKVNAENAIIVRKFWGESSLDQVTVNDKVNIIGTWTDTKKTAINAFLIRDISIQEESDGVVGSMSGIPSFTFQTAKKGTFIVSMTALTKITDDNNMPIQFNTINPTDQLRVYGVVNWVNKTITATKIVDTSSLSTLPSPSLSPSISPTVSQ